MVNILFCVNRIRTETFWLKFFVLIRATESHPALWLHEMQVTSEWCPPLITVLDRQQLDKAAWVAVPLGLSVAKGFQYTVDLHFPSIIWHYGLLEFLYYLYISITYLKHLSYMPCKNGALLPLSTTRCQCTSIIWALKTACYQNYKSKLTQILTA